MTRRVLKQEDRDNDGCCLVMDVDNTMKTVDSDGDGSWLAMSPDTVMALIWKLFEWRAEMLEAENGEG